MCTNQKVTQQTFVGDRSHFEKNRKTPPKIQKRTEVESPSSRICDANASSQGLWIVGGQWRSGCVSSLTNDIHLHSDPVATRTERALSPNKLEGRHQLETNELCRCFCGSSVGRFSFAVSLFCSTSRIDKKASDRIHPCWL